MSIVGPAPDRPFAANAAVLILFCEGFDEADVQMHEALVRRGAPGVLVRSFVVHTAADIAAAARCAAGYDASVVWNCYWPVDPLSTSINERFADRLVGSRHSVTARTSTKSATYRQFQYLGLPCVWHRRVDTVAELDAVADVPFPVVVKADAGYDAVDMTDRSICAEPIALRQEVARLAARHPGVMVQKFLAGREFTIAYGGHRTFRPVEKIFEPGQLLGLAGGPSRQIYCNDGDLETRLRSIADRIGHGFGLTPSDYCRIDIREDTATGDLVPIDVNDMCSLYPESWFEFSLAGDGHPIEHVADWLTAPLRRPAPSPATMTASSEAGFGSAWAAS